jgi:molybdenum ABC transporter molybdate-binding protein
LPPTIYAAGSLRSGLNEVIERFSQRTGIVFNAVYGPSGKFRQDIESGQRPDVFASASTEHTDALFSEGFLRNSVTFVRNTMCLLAAPGVDIGQGNLLDKMLDPAMRLGTSTPQMDPAGDYAWALFRNAEKLQAGTFDQLDQKALKLVGNPAVPAEAARSVPDLLKDHQVDLFVTYCSYAKKTAEQVPGVTWRKFPDELNVEASYGIGAVSFADKRSDRLIRFILGAEGQRILAKHGFEPVKAVQGGSAP